jgi:hypothetical protein
MKSYTSRGGSTLNPSSLEEGLKQSVASADIIPNAKAKKR